MTTLKREIETADFVGHLHAAAKEQELSVTSGTPDNIKIAANAVVPTEPTGPAATGYFCCIPFLPGGRDRIGIPDGLP